MSFSEQAAMAQSGSQVIMRGNPDGTHEVIQLTAPNYLELRTPDFTRRDLPVMQRSLVLSDEQVNAVALLVDQYLEQFRTLTRNFATAAHEPSAEYNPQAETTPAADSGGPMQMSLDGLGVTLPPNVNINFGTMINRSRSDDPNTPPPPPEVKVSATIDAPEGEEIPDDVIAKIQNRANEVAASLAEHIMAEEAARHAGGDSAPRPFIADRNFDEIIAEHEALMASVQEFQRDRAQLRSQFVMEVQAFLAKEQVERWPALERALYRERSLPKGELPAESIDLVKIIDEFKFVEGVLQSIASDLEAYEIALDAALRQRDAFIATSAQKIDKAIAERKPDVAISLADRGTALRAAVRGVNHQHIANFAARLGPQDGERFRLAALKSGYPNVYNQTRGRRMFEQLKKVDGLDEPTRRGLVDLETAYEMELAAVNEQIRNTTDRERPLEARRGLERLKGSMEGATGMPQREDPVRALFVKRGRLDDRYQNLVAQLLGAERAAAIPRSRKDRDPIRIESGIGAAEDNE